MTTMLSRLQNKAFLPKAYTAIVLLLWLAPLDAQVAVIAHQAVPADSITKAKLLDFYTGDSRSWGSGVEVVVFDLKVRGTIRKTFYKFLGKSSSRMKSLWLKRMLSGEGDPPDSVPDELELIAKIATTPGSIGFVNSAKVSKSVKTLLVLPLPPQ